MQFIGQYIQKFISRFKNDVFLERVGSGTIASGGNLGLDSNNKIVKANVLESVPPAVTLAGSLDYITLSGQEISRNAIDLAADVTGTLPVSNGGTGVTSLGSIDISSFNNDSGFTTNTGDITSVAISEGSNTRTVSSGDATINFVQGEGIDVASATLNSSTVQLTISGEDASDSNKGVVELATTGEADTGTDTARAVTPAGLKSHVDARVIPWVVITGQFNPGSSTAYFAPNNQGIFNAGWSNTDAKFDDSDERIPFFKQNGFIVPCACTLVNIRGYIRKPVVGAKTYKFKILKIAAGDILYETNGNADTTRIFSDLSIAFTDTNSSRYKAVSIDGTEALAQGDMLVPMIANTNGDYSNNTHFQFSFSIST